MPKGKRPVKDDDDEDDDLGGNTGQSLQQLLQQLIAKNSNNVDATAMNLLQQTYTLRQKNSALRRERDELKESLPADDAVVLTADQAKLWTAFQALGKPEEIKANLDKLNRLTEYEALGTVEELKTKTTQADADAKELSNLRRGETLRKAAGLAKYPAEVFTKLFNKLEPDLKIEFESVTVDGNTVERPVVIITENGSSKKEPLADYLKANHAEILPALEAGAAGNTGNNGNGNAGNRVPVPEHTPPTGGGGGNLLDDFIAERNKTADAASNPLMPK
jgi:hypothetical protein